MNERRNEEGEGRERRVETKPNDHAYPSNPLPPLHPRLATRIELIQGAKLDTRILIIAEKEGAIQEYSRHANSPSPSSSAALFPQPKNIFISPSYDE